MDTTGKTNIEAVTDISIIDSDCLADLDDDPPGLDHTRSEIKHNKCPLIRRINHKLGVLTQIVLGSLVGGMTGAYMGFPPIMEEIKHKQCVLADDGIHIKTCQWAYKVG